VSNRTGPRPATRTAKRRSRRIALLALLGLHLSVGTSALAHVGGNTAFADVSIDGSAIRYSLTLSSLTVAPELADAMRLGVPGQSPNFQPLLDAIAQKVHFTSDGTACSPGAGVATPPSPNSVSVTFVASFGCPEPIRELTIRDDLFDAIGTDYHVLTRIEWSGGSQQFAFAAENREARVIVSSAAAPSRGAGSFLPLGIEHILTGYDHLLFLLALVLRGGNIWSLLKIVTAFTLAHSITLALAALNIVMLPERLVDATIALSIAYVAAENLFMRHTVSHRWAVAFIFGLMHGFGFSSVLRELGLPKEGLVWALLNFNLGVEAGQAIAVIVAVPLLMWLRRFRWEPRAVAAISVAVLVVGLALFVDRAFLAGGPRVLSSMLPFYRPLLQSPLRSAVRPRFACAGPTLDNRNDHTWSCLEGWAVFSSIHGRQSAPRFARRQFVRALQNGRRQSTSCPD